MNDDHELFNTHLGRVNKRDNDIRESKKRKNKMKRSDPPMMFRILMISFM